MVVLAVGAAGGDGWVLTVTIVAVEIQVLSVVLLTIMLCDPTAIPAKVAEA